jgi:hypothetical protein
VGRDPSMDVSAVRVGQQAANISQSFCRVLAIKQPLLPWDKSIGHWDSSAEFRECNCDWRYRRHSSAIFCRPLELHEHGRIAALAVALGSSSCGLLAWVE